MMQLLPTEILNWVNPKDFNLDHYSINNPIEYILEVELDYPEELHDLHNDCSLGSEKTEIRKEILFDYQLQIIEDNNFSLAKTKRNITNLGNKRKYKLHHQNLKLYFILELQFQKSYRIIEFKQEPFLKQ